MITDYLNYFKKAKQSLYRPGGLEGSSRLRLQIFKAMGT